MGIQALDIWIQKKKMFNKFEAQPTYHQQLSGSSGM